MANEYEASEDDHTETASTSNVTINAEVAASALAFLQAAASALARLIPIPHYFPTEPALHLYYRTGQVQQVVVAVIPTKADSFLVLGAHLEDIPAAEVAPAVFQVDMVAAEVALAMVAVVPPHPC